jgi:hypothetical protein
MNKKTIGTEQKLWIIGDSFAGLSFGHNSWQWYLYEGFAGKNMYVSSKGSRDIQTIFDIFLQNIHKINSNDVVILFLPSLIRFRLPLNQPYDDVELCSDPGHKATCGFIGNEQYKSNRKNTTTTAEEIDIQNKFRLESPLDELDLETFDPQLYYTNNILNFANITQMISSSKVFSDNWNMILKSIQLYVPFKLIYYSWADELDSSIVNNRDVITKNLNMWTTLANEYENSNGQFGVEGDAHWNSTMHKAFAEHIIKSYPQYFSYEPKIL